MVLAGVARKVAAVLGDQDYVRLVARQHDPDALAAATLLALALEREGVDFHFSAVDPFDTRVFARLREEKNDALVLLDVPDVPADEAHGLASAIVTVHDAEDVDPVDGAIAVTAEEAGVRGGLEACTGTLALAVALELSHRNRDLAVLALAGALAEGQHAGGGLKGLNAEYAWEAFEEKALERGAGLTVEGDTLLEVVAQGVDPFFPGLGGRARLAKRALDAAGVPHDARVTDLAGDALERTASALALRLLEADAPDGALDALAQPPWRASGTVLEGEECARLARAVRAAAATGDAAGFVSWPWRRAGAHAGDGFAKPAAEFRENALGALVRLEKDVRETKGPLLLDEAPPGYARALADLAACTLAPPRRPVLVVERADAHALVAARAPRAAALGGVDVGDTLRDAASAFEDARATGNRASALARVPAAHVDAFLKHAQGALGA